MDRDRFLVLTLVAILIALVLSANAYDQPQDKALVIVAWVVSCGLALVTIALIIRDHRRWVRMPLSAKLSSLIHACNRDPDAPAVKEFIETHKDDAEFQRVVPAILYSFRLDRDFRRNYWNQSQS